MQRDGRGFDHRTLEAIRLMAMERVREGEKLREKIDAQLAAIKRTPALVRSFFRAPTVA